MEGIIKFTPLLFSVGLAYMYIILGTSKLTNAQTLPSTEVVDISPESKNNLRSEEHSTLVLNVTNSNESLAVLNLDVPVTTLQQENQTERLDIVLLDDNSTKPNNVTEAISVNSTTGNGTLSDQNITAWSTDQNQTTGNTSTAAFGNFLNDTAIIIDVPRTSDSGNRTNVTSSGSDAPLHQNTTLPPISTDGTTFTGFYTYNPIDANNTEVELLENQTSVIFLSSNVSQDDGIPKVESQTTFPTTDSNQTTAAPSVTITSYTDAFNMSSDAAASENQTTPLPSVTITTYTDAFNMSSDGAASENQTTPSPSVTITSYTDAFNMSSENQTLEVIIIPLNESESVPTMGPTTTLQIDSSLNVTETTTTMTTLLAGTGTSLDSTTSKRTIDFGTHPDATKGRSWSSTLKNKLTTPIFPANTTKGTSPIPEPSNLTSRTEHYTVGESENSTTVPATMVTLLFIPYAYGNESTTSTTEFTTPTATTTSPTMITSISSSTSTTSPTMITSMSMPSSTTSRTMITSMSTPSSTSPTMITSITSSTSTSPTMITSISTPTSTTERKMVTTTQMTTVTESSQTEVDKVKEKPSKKKAYEELLPEEKENIVTVVFNKLSENTTENFEDVFCYFVSRIMNNYLKMWSTLKEPENELSSGPEQAEVLKKNIHFLKPTPYFSKDTPVIMVTFYVTSTSPSGTLTVFPAEVVMQNIKEARHQIQKELNLNATEIFIGVHPNFDAIKLQEERQLFSHFEPLFIALIAVGASCLFILLTAIICFKCRQKGLEYGADREKLNQERTYSLRGQDLRPECEILREERQMAEKDGGMMNGEKKHPVRQNGEEGWVVPIGEMPLEEQNAPAIQDTRL